MKQSELETLRAQAAKVELPQSVREAIVAEATSLDQAEQQPQTQRVTRRTFLRVGVAAAAVGVGAFLGLSIFGDEETLPVFDDGSGDGKHGFVLTAYADGMPQDNGSVLPLANFTGSGFWGPNHDNWFDACFSFMLGCTIEGEGAESVTYELEGPYCIEGDPDDDEVTRVVFFGESDLIEKTCITVPYENQDTKETQICASFPASESLQELDDRYQTQHKESMLHAIEAGTNKGETDWDLENEYKLALRMIFNEYLATTTLHISVNYADGTVLEKRYAIAAIDDFEEVYAAHLQAVTDWWLAYEAGSIAFEDLNATEPKEPPLYTIREIDG